MNPNTVREIPNIASTLLISLLVWGYYRRRTFAPSERYATFAPRFWTGSVDSCVLWPVSLPAGALLYSLNTPRGLAAPLFIVQNLAWLLYTVVMHARYGQTAGKMVTKVRVVDFRTEGSISWWQAWLRGGIPIALSLGFVGWLVFLILTGGFRGDPASVKVFWLLAALPGLWFVAEVLTMLTNDKRRALHDYIAGTVVVRTNTEEVIA